MRLHNPHITLYKVVQLLTLMIVFVMCAAPMPMALAGDQVEEQHLLADVHDEHEEDGESTHESEIESDDDKPIVIPSIFEIFVDHPEAETFAIHISASWCEPNSPPPEH